MYTIDLIRMDYQELVALDEGQKFVRDYFSETTNEEDKDKIKLKALSKKNEAIRKANYSKTRINEVIETIYLLAYIFIDKGLNSENNYTKEFLQLDKKDDINIRGKVMQIFTEIQLPNLDDTYVVLNENERQKYREITVTTVPPAVANDSLTEIDKVASAQSAAVEEKKRNRAKVLLEYTFRKFDALRRSKSSGIATIDEGPYFNENYYKAMGFDKTNLTYNQGGKQVSISTYKDYILDDKIYDMVKKFIDKITYEGTLNNPYTFTLHDVIGRWVSVDKSNPKTNSSDPSDYCKARAIFISILKFIKENVPPLSWATFRYSSSGGLLKSSKVCNPSLQKIKEMNIINPKTGQIVGTKVVNIDPFTNPLDTVDPKKPFCTIETNLTDVVLLGGAKSRRIRRRKHNRKTHRKHARKTHHKRGGRRTHSYAKRKRASKSHKRRK